MWQECGAETSAETDDGKNDTTDNKFRDELLAEPLDIQGQVKANKGRVRIPTGSGIGVTPDMDFIKHYEIDA